MLITYAQPGIPTGSPLSRALMWLRKEIKVHISTGSLSYLVLQKVRVCHERHYHEILRAGESGFVQTSTVSCMNRSAFHGNFLASFGKPSTSRMQTGERVKDPQSFYSGKAAPGTLGTILLICQTEFFDRSFPDI